jgi:hypothetical protein
MKTLLLFALGLVTLASCTDSDGSSLMGGYSDGTYCAEVDYYNPNTGTSSTYTLQVEIEEDELVTIYWPNGGWLDDTHFTSTDISDGYASFSSDEGYDFEVRIIGEGGGCTTDTYINEEETTEYTGEYENTEYTEDDYY